MKGLKKRCYSLRTIADARLPACISYAESIAGRAQLSDKNMFYTYVLKSLKDGKLYIGFCSDLKRRITEHNSGLVDATRPRRPLKLVYYEACLDKEKAVAREKVLKTGFGRKYLSERL